MSTPCVRPHGLAFVGLLFAAATTGLMYMFSAFSEALKDELGLSQDDIDTIYMWYALGGVFSFLPGKLADALGARRAVAFGGTVQALGLAGVFVVAKKWYVAPRVGPVFLLSACNLFGWVGVATTAAASFAALSRLYSGRRGLVVGVGKAWVGMFGALVTQGYRCAFPSRGDATALAFVAVLACAALALAWAGAAAMGDAALGATFRGAPGDGRCGAILAVVGLSVAAATVAALADLGGALRLAWAAVIAALFLAPWATVFLPEAADAIAAPAESPLLAPAPAPAPPPLEGAPTLAMVRDPACWLLLFTFCCTTGGGVVVTVNGAQMAIAAGAGPRGADTVVTVFAVAQASARVAGGAAADALRQRGRPIAALLVAACVVMAAAHGVMWVSTPGALFGGTALAGAAYGTTFPVVVLLVRELWGEKHFGANYNVYDGGGGSVGTVAFAKYLVQLFYDAHKVPVAGKTGEFTCAGPRCFPFPAVVALCGSAVVTAGLLCAGPLKPAPFVAAKRPPDPEPINAS